MACPTGDVSEPIFPYISMFGEDEHPASSSIIQLYLVVQSDQADPLHADLSTQPARKDGRMISMLGVVIAFTE